MFFLAHAFSLIFSFTFLLPSLLYDFALVFVVTDLYFPVSHFCPLKWSPFTHLPLVLMRGISFQRHSAVSVTFENWSSTWISYSISVRNLVTKTDRLEENCLWVFVNPFFQRMLFPSFVLVVSLMHPEINKIQQGRRKKNGPLL